MNGQLLQIETFQTENDVTLPATVRLKGTDLVLPLRRVVTFTGTRFLRSVGVPTGRNGESGMPEGLSFPEDELEIAKAVFSMMADSPPESMSIEQLRGVLHMCQFCVADTLLGGFPAYLEGAVRSCPEVCFMLPRVRLFSVVPVGSLERLAVKCIVSSFAASLPVLVARALARAARLLRGLV